MKYFLYITICSLLLNACSRDEHYSPDLNNASLLPNRNDYLNSDYGTQALAEEIYNSYSKNDSVNIKMIKYDEKTRNQPILTFTEGKWTLNMKPLPNGALEFGYKDFHTKIMPLKMITKINVILKLNAKKDTIFLQGTDGSVRTSAVGQTIGTPLPQSDEAELKGYYVRNSKKLYVLFDLMLPIAIKAHITGNK